MCLVASHHCCPLMKDTACLRSTLRRAGIDVKDAWSTAQVVYNAEVLPPAAASEPPSNQACGGGGGQWKHDRLVDSLTELLPAHSCGPLHREPEWALL